MHPRYTGEDEPSKGHKSMQLIEMIARRGDRVFGNGVRVLIFIAERTLIWGKEWERVTLDQFLRGNQKAADPRFHYYGLSMNKRTLIEHIRVLESAGAIEVRRDPDGNWYRVNLDWEPPEEDMTLLKRSKKPREGRCQSAPTVGAKVHQGQVPKCTNINKPLITGSLTNDHSSERSARDALTDVGSGVVSSGKKRQSRKRAATRQTTKLSELEKVWWAPAIRETWPEAPIIGWTVKVKAQVKRWLKSDWQTEESFPEFLLWVAENWKTVWATKMQYVEVQYPEYPDIGFLYAYRRAFMESYVSRDELQDKLDKDVHRKRYRRARRAGHSHEKAEEMARQAVENVSQAQRLTEHSDTLSEREQELERRERQLREREAKAALDRRRSRKVNRGAVRDEADYEVPNLTQHKWEDDEDE